jgi:hypothetical protein
MANIKITDLSGYTNPESTDVLPIVDVTNDETKKVSIADLMENAGSGTEALPGIAFDGDPNTGIYRPGADQLAISTAGTQRLLISDTGAVTIPGDLTVQGTTTTIDTETLVVQDKNIELGVVDSPTDTTADGGGITLKGATDKTINWVNATDAWTSSERFDFPAGTAAAPSIILNGDVNSGIYQPGADQVAISTNGTGRLFVDANGNVGIGAAPDAAFALDATAGNGAIRAQASGFYVAETYSATNNIYRIYDNSGEFAIESQIFGNPTATSSPIVFRTSNSGGRNERMRITADGRLGVGTTSPSELITGRGNIFLETNSTSADSGAGVFWQSTTSGWTTSGAHAAIYGKRVNGSNGYLRFDTRSGGTTAERARIDSSGRLLVGTSTSVSGSTSHKLQVASDAGGYLNLARSDASVGTGSILGRIGGYSYAGSTYDLVGQIDIVGDGTHATGDKPTRLTFSTTADGASSPTERMRIDRNGRVGIGTTSPGAKLNIEGSGVDGAKIRIGFDSTRYYDIFRDSTGNGLFNFYGSQAGFTGYVFGGVDGERARIDSSGRLGLGTSTPPRSLTNAGSITLTTGTAPQYRLNGTAADGDDDDRAMFGLATAAAQFMNGAAIGDAVLRTTNGGNLLFGEGTTERMRLDSSGRLGIGTTNPSQRLNLNIGGDQTWLQIDKTRAADEAMIQLVHSATNRGSKIRYANADSSWVVGIDSSESFVFTSGEDSTGGGGTERARIDSSGRLLVGTSSDSQTSTLVLKGNSAGVANAGTLRIERGQGAGSITSSNIELGTIALGGSAIPSALVQAYSDGNWTVGTSYPTRLAFSTTADGASSPTERMRITNNGKFKFSDSGAYISSAGTSHEFRNGSSNNIIRFSSTNATPYGGIIEYENAAPNSTGQEFLVCQDSSASRFRFRSNGGLANYQSNDANLCDEREKKNIETLDSTWGCLKNWDLKKFHYNEDADTDDKRYGVIAQQVAQHCPEVITDWVKQKAEDAVLDDDGNVVTPAVEEVTRMGVKEQQMMWMAIKALQEAQTRIEALEAEVAALKSA